MTDTDTEGLGIGIRNGDPPLNREGEYVCGRACINGSRCLATIPFPNMACWQHDRTDPIVGTDADNPRYADEQRR